MAFNDKAGQLEYRVFVVVDLNLLKSIGKFWRVWSVDIDCVFHLKLDPSFNCIDLFLKVRVGKYFVVEYSPLHHRIHSSDWSLLPKRADVGVEREV